MLQHGEGQRAHDRLGMAPADALQRPPGVGGVDRLVANIAEVARPIAPQGFQDFRRAGRADERDNRSIRSFFVPVVHGVHEPLTCLMRGRQLAFLDRGHHPAAAFLFIARL